MDLSDIKTKDMLDNVRKGFIIICMLVVGIMLLLYKLDIGTWQDNFDSYVNMVIGVSVMLIVVGMMLLFIDVKRFLRFELLGFIMLIIAGVVIGIYPAAPVLDMTAGTGILVVGIILTIIAGILLARNGGYFTPCLMGLAFQIAFAGYYSMMNPDATSFHSNAFVASNIGIGFLVLSFILMVYHDLKFYYLAKLIKNANRLRKEKKYDEALKYCNKALFIFPNFVTALNNKGNILFNMKKPKEAIEYYTKAIKINPNYKQAVNNLEVVERKMGRAMGQ